MGRGKYESYKSGIRGERERLTPYPANGIANDLVIGERYTLNMITRGHVVTDGGAPAKHIEAKLAGLFPHVAVFEYAFGYTEAFDYWALERILVR